MIYSYILFYNIIYSCTCTHIWYHLILFCINLTQLPFHPFCWFLVDTFIAALKRQTSLQPLRTGALANLPAEKAQPCCPDFILSSHQRKILALLHAVFYCMSRWWNPSKGMCSAFASSEIFLKLEVKNKVKSLPILFGISIVWFLERHFNEIQEGAPHGGRCRQAVALRPCCTHNSLLVWCPDRI